MENEAQIKGYIKEKEKDSVLWNLENITTEFNSLVGREKEETKDWLHLFEWLKNDKSLLKYAELKMKDEKDLKRWEKFNLELLELRLSITCKYFKDFKIFLEDLKRGEVVEDTSTDTWQNMQVETIDLQNSYFCWVSVWEIQSYPFYRNSQSWVTRCSRTARMNGQNFGLNLPKWDAYNAWEKPWENSINSLPKNKKEKKPSKNWSPLNIWEFNSIWNDINFADIYTESKSNYWHRAVAFRDNTWQRYVLDPYTRVNGVLNSTPKKLQDYMKNKKIVKAHFYKSNWYSHKDLSYN